MNLKNVIFLLSSLILFDASPCFAKKQTIAAWMFDHPKRRKIFERRKAELQAQSFRQIRR